MAFISVLVFQDLYPLQLISSFNFSIKSKLLSYILDVFSVSCRHGKRKCRNFQANFIILEFSVFRNFSLFLPSFGWMKFFILISVKLIINFCLNRGSGRRTWRILLSSRFSNKTCIFEGNRSPQPTVKLRCQNLVLSYIPYSLVAYNMYITSFYM